MIIASLSISRMDWLLGAVVLLVAGLVLVWSRYQSLATLNRPMRLARVLKWVALCVLAICLVEPVWSGFMAKPQANLMLLLVDNSRGMSVQTDDSPSLFQRIQKLLAPADQGNWLTRLEQDFGLQQFAFDRRVRPLNSQSGLDGTGSRSALKSALTDLAQRYRGRPVGGVILLTDGQATDLTLPTGALAANDPELQSLLSACKSLGAIYPVQFEQRNTRPDAAIETVTVSETAFEDAPVTVQCDVRTTGIAALKATELSCRLLHQDGSVVEEQTSTVTKAGEKQVFRLQLRPTTQGLAFYELDVRLSVGQNDRAEPLSEITLLNNRRTIMVQRGATRHRVLYVAGRPNWDFKFLRRAIDREDLVDLVGLIRIAKREAKFDFRGRDGQSSNALFRGFKSETDDGTERFDEPVFVRLNTQNADELRAGFPQTAEELFGFDALIIDDAEAAFFSRDQQSLIERFVSERGGSVLMIGGQESFSSGNYDRTPIADLLPVYLDRVSYPEDGALLKLDLTREGWLQNWMRLRSTEDSERERLQQMPSFVTLNPVRGVKPGASVLATLSSPDGKRWPALVTQKFGRGHSAAFLLGDVYRWQLQQTDPENDDLGKAWRQTIRWLVSDVPHRLQLTTEAAPDFGPDAVRVLVKAVDAEFRPLDNARVQLRIKAAPRVAQKSGDDAASDESTMPTSDADSSDEKSSPKLIDADPSDHEPGLSSTVFIPTTEGPWSIVATAQDGNGKALPTEETAWIHSPLDDEFRAVGVNSDFLQQLAKGTGGRVISEGQIEHFASELRSQSMPVMEAWTMPLWDHPLVFALVALCLVGEWSLRRMNGAA